MPYKVKVLTWKSSVHGGTAEGMLQRWFDKNKNITVKKQSQSESRTSEAHYQITYTILYLDQRRQNEKE